LDALLEFLVIALRTVVSFAFVIGFIATIHEFGHFIIAKLCGVRVDEFSLGVGKALMTRKYGDTEYNLRWIPILAYVRPAGMDPEEEFEPGNEPGERSFQAKNFWAKQAILLGGSLFNFLGAMGIITGVLFFRGTPVSTIRVGSVIDGSPAQAAGVMDGDIFLRFDSQPDISDYNAGVAYINAHPGVPVQVHLARPRTAEVTVEEGFLQNEKAVELLTLPVTPRDNGSGRGLMGIRVEAFYLPGRAPIRVPFGTALERGVGRTMTGIRLVFSGMVNLITRSIGKMEVPKEVGGPVQIIHIISKESKYGVQNLLFLTAQLSVSIGVFNLLPVPALDGGRMLLLLIATLAGWVAEKLGRESPEQSLLLNRMEEWLHVLGFLFLISVMILVTWKDVREIFWGGSKAAPAPTEAPKVPGKGEPVPPSDTSPEAAAPPEAQAP
jgi:regulator of sigma E protease